jgi:hypothetical protein
LTLLASCDPIAASASMTGSVGWLAPRSKHAYAVGNPLNATDPSGQCLLFGCAIDGVLQDHGLCVVTDANCANSLASQTPGLKHVAKAAYDAQAPSPGQAYMQTCFGVVLFQLCDTATKGGSGLDPV